jgi:hypothetical protein
MADVQSKPPRARKPSAPTEVPIVGELIPTMLEEARATRAERMPAVEGTKMRGSLAAGCARQLSYIWWEDKEFPDGVPESNPATRADLMRFYSGTLIHEGLATAVQRVWPSIEFEAEKVWQLPEINASGRMDLWFPNGVPTMIELGMEGPVVGEAKSIGGFQFKKISGQFRVSDDAEGPKMKAIYQGALGALALDAQWLLLPYFGLEITSPQTAQSNGLSDHHRYSAEWIIPRETWEPLALGEIERIKKIYEHLERGELAPRAVVDPEVPRRARITDPKTGAWVLTASDDEIIDAGNTWVCGYCSHRDQCLHDGAKAKTPTRIPVAAE